MTPATREATDFRAFLMEISHELSTQNVEELKYLVSGVVPKSRLEGVDQGYHIFSLLEEGAHICDEDLTYLQYLMQSLHRHDLYIRIRDFSTKVSSIDEQIQSNYSQSGQGLSICRETEFSSQEMKKPAEYSWVDPKLQGSESLQPNTRRTDSNQSLEIILGSVALTEMKSSPEPRETEVIDDTNTKSLGLDLETDAPPTVNKTLETALSEEPQIKPELLRQRNVGSILEKPKSPLTRVTSNPIRIQFKKKDKNYKECDGYRLGIVGGQHYEVEDGQEYVELQSGQKFQIMLQNTNKVKCNVDVYVDGKQVILAQLEENEKSEFDCPTYKEETERKHFVFYRVAEAPAESGIRSTLESGVVEAQFLPAIQSIHAKEHASRGAFRGYDPKAESSDSEESDSDSDESDSSSDDVSRGWSAGGVALQGPSHAKFSAAEDLVVDEKQKTTLMVKLVGKDDDHLSAPPAEPCYPLHS
ncbi:uncharacterized protein LOC106167062 isoform X1 [Lingula anatina]|uniref:Uncharacterized protein LOC106167062 isoform X1 n=1 Tax=Lingula anatina TaxID=7574 RepID=A0A1S3IT08_LINAN|nr:uncharacterized protein LOC106167062 isoform X1 [Lingula anatina]|eukprot:XP_013401213.1 uncharacterized protein LOC106167062 isoform X1 [Lingula anatina]